MTRKEITKEAEKQVNYCTPYHVGSFIQGYVAGAESREKRIEELDMKRKAERQIFQGIVEKKNEQLTKATKIIKNLLILKNDHYGNTKMEWRVEVTEQAEQFLKEIEK